MAVGLELAVAADREVGRVGQARQEPDVMRGGRLTVPMRKPSFDLRGVPSLTTRMAMSNSQAN